MVQGGLRGGDTRVTSTAGVRDERCRAASLGVATRDRQSSSLLATRASALHARRYGCLIADSSAVQDRVDAWFA